MENSINSSNSEATIAGLKSIFKKPTDFYQAFEVSLEESVTAAQSNKSEPDLDISSGTQKQLPFKKSRKSMQQPFSVSLSDSVAKSESEQSITFVKPQSVFKKKNKSLVDFFNVSFNESNTSLQANVSGKSIDESAICNKTNPFKRNDCENDITIGNVSSVHATSDENDKISESQSRILSDYDGDGDDADSTAFVTKENIFKKSAKQKNDSLTQLKVSITDENKSLESKTSELANKTTDTLGLNNESDSSITKTKLNPFQRKESLENDDLVISVTEHRSDRSSEKTPSTDPKQTSKNISLNRSISKERSNTTSLLEQSSVNDENLNNWMSDHSDEELPVPSVHSGTANLSLTKEKPPVPGSPTVERPPLSVWEQKFLDIISNAEKKCQAAKASLNSNPPSKPKQFKKSDMNIEKLGEVSDKYKPPKLIKPAAFATKKLYDYIIKKLEPKYGIDTIIKSENLVLSICDAVKKVTRKKSYQKRLIQNLKKEMAEAGLIETTMDFYEFVIKFLPYSFRVKAVPCLQPVTNVVYPPKDPVNPFDKILGM